MFIVLVFLFRHERKVKELTFQLEEETKNAQRVQEQLDKITTRNKTLRRQFEEAVRSEITLR